MVVTSFCCVFHHTVILNHHSARLRAGVDGEEGLGGVHQVLPAHQADQLPGAAAAAGRAAQGGVRRRPGDDAGDAGLRQGLHHVPAGPHPGRRARADHGPDGQDAGGRAGERYRRRWRFWSEMVVGLVGMGRSENLTAWLGLDAIIHNQSDLLLIMDSNQTTAVNPVFILGVA